MAGLVGYASSDEGSDNEEQNSPQEQPIIPQVRTPCHEILYFISLTYLIQPIQEISKPEHAKQAEAAAGRKFWRQFAVPIHILTSPQRRSHRLHHPQPQQSKPPHSQSRK